MRKLLRILFGIVAAAVALASLFAVAGFLVLQSSWFRDQVRERIVSAVEVATGGRVEIGSFAYNSHRLTASVTPFILHGTEAAGQPPFFRADKIEIGIRIISVFERHYDLAFIDIEKPAVSVTVGPDGSTNVPQPKLARGLRESFIRQLFAAKVGRFSLHNGWADFNSKRIPLDVTANGVNADLRFFAQRNLYAATIAANSVRGNSPLVDNAQFTLAAKLTIGESRLQVEQLALTRGESSVHVSGELEDMAAPRGDLNVEAALRGSDLAAPFRLPANNGSVAFTGKLSFTAVPTLHWQLQGSASGRALAYQTPQLDLNNVSFSSPVKITKDDLALPNLSLSALGGTFHGRVRVERWHAVKLSGDVTSVPVHNLAAALRTKSDDLNGEISGPVQLEANLARGGLSDSRIGAKLSLRPGQTGIPLKGTVDVNYDQSNRLLTLGDSILALGSSQLEISGAVGQTLAVHAVSGNLHEVLAVLPLLGEPVPKLELELKGGTARFDGTVTGPLANPRVSGHLNANRFTWAGRPVDQASATVDVNESGSSARSLSLDQGPLHAEGSLRVGFTHWHWSDTSPLAASFAIRGADIPRLSHEFEQGKAPAKLPFDVRGSLSGSVQVGGTLAQPSGTADLSAQRLLIDDQPFENVKLHATLNGGDLVVSSATFSVAGGFVTGKGTYHRQGQDWSTGRMQFEAAEHGASLARVEALRKLYSGLAGSVEAAASGSAQITKGDFRTETISAKAAIPAIVLDGHNYGKLTLTAESHGDTMDVHANATVAGTPLQGSGEWKLTGDDPGHGEIVIPRITVAALHQLVPSPQRGDLPFDGFLEGRIDLDGPLRKPDQIKAHAVISTLQVNASSGAHPRAGAQSRDLVLRTAKPLVLDATLKGLEIRNAQLIGTDTTIEANGRLTFDAASPWDMHVKGSVNLAILQIFNPDLLGSGLSLVDAAIRGPLAEPQIEGHLELKNASLYLSDLPNGLDQANGLILFDRNRATVDSLNAVTGGGTVNIAKGSFVGFRGPTLLYHVQANADHVRYRSPEGISLTANALLSMTGTSANSVLAGTVTVIRAGFNPTTDVGRLLASTAKPVSAPQSANEYVRGIQFDVRVESAQALEIQTSLTRNIQAEASLRIRGTPDRPLVLGTISVTEGQIDFFGNRYHINRGEVSFVNPVKIEPILDMDLETTVRGITVDVSFTGPLNKLSFAYSSDPPLQSSDIIALLAVGRTPATGNTLAPNQAAGAANYLSTGGNGLLSQAITPPTAGRLQRFFGVSHIKIDPQLTDITSVPQARLTLEQQISKDVTLIYITNLTRTQEQIVRFEWALDRQWSIIALRDENGAFGVDFQYRKRFK